MNDLPILRTCRTTDRDARPRSRTDLNGTGRRRGYLRDQKAGADAGLAARSWIGAIGPDTRQEV
jgi:hypothetical protein